MTDQAIRQSAGGRSLPHSSCRKKANGKRKLALTPVTAVAPRSRLLDRNFRAPSVIADLPIFIPLRFHQLLQEFCEGARNERPIRTPVYWKSNGDRTKIGLLWIASITTRSESPKNRAETKSELKKSHCLADICREVCRIAWSGSRTSTPTVRIGDP